MKKICNICKKYKTLEEFGKNSKLPDGLQLKCKTCKREYDNDYHKKRNTATKKAKYNKQVARLKKVRVYLINYLEDKSCVTCGENRLPTLKSPRSSIGGAVHS